jgi:hypothetical protein
MSNQAQKARLRTVARINKGDMFADADRKKRMALGEARRMELDPQKNPSGRAKYGIEEMKYNVVRGEVRGSPSPLPDPSASARGANVRANKERGTQSSTQRKVIK